MYISKRVKSFIKQKVQKSSNWCLTKLSRISQAGIISIEVEGKDKKCK